MHAWLENRVTRPYTQDMVTTLFGLAASPCLALARFAASSVWIQPWGDGPGGVRPRRQEADQARYAGRQTSIRGPAHLRGF